MHYVHVCLLKICFFSALPLKNILLSVIYCHKSVIQQLPLGQAQQGSRSVRLLSACSVECQQLQYNVTAPVVCCQSAQGLCSVKL